MAHIDELKRNLDVLQPWLDPGDHENLLVLILTHDTFKRDAARGVPIFHPMSHSSLAADFLALFTDNFDLVEMVQRHDEPYALHKKVASGQGVDEKRLNALENAIKDMRLFCLFQIIDNVTEGKKHTSVYWFLDLMHHRKHERIPVDAISAVAQSLRQQGKI